MELTPTVQKFVLHWGEMGSRWGINRSVAQIHALLYIAARPLPADEIAGTLGIARSNVSMCLKELLGWKIVRTVHVLGDRRDHFEAVHDVWELFRIILAERKKREADPTLQHLRECLQNAGTPDSEADRIARERLAEMLSFFELLSEWGDRAASLSSANLRRLLTLGDKVFRLVGVNAPDQRTTIDV